MGRKIEKLFRAPYGVPNGLQVTDEGLWIADQITDRVALVEITEPSGYGVTKLVRDIPSDCSNTSGMCYGDGALWLAANGAGEQWRPARPNDAKPGLERLLRPIHIPANASVGIRYRMAVARTAWNTIIMKRAISGSKH